MSSTSGVANKADKNKAKFKAIDINNVFKGTSVAPQKTAATARQHGLQSLGKVASRRMPPPAHLPSLKSEQGGTDQTVSIVPAGGSGWGNSGKEEDNRTSTPVSSSQISLSQPSLSQPSTVSGRPSSQVSNQTKVSVSADVNNTSTANNQSWSSVTSTAKGQGGRFTIAKSKFQEEFPELASGFDDKAVQPRKEESKELQYGPGPSLRPQNVASWRDGGGRSIVQQTQDDDRSSSPAAGPAVKRDASSSDDDEPDHSGSGYHAMQPQHDAVAAAAMTRMMQPGMMHRPGPRMGGPPGGPMMFGPIMPFMFSGPRFGPQFPGFPPVPPPFFHPDQRFRGPLVAPRMNFDGPLTDKQAPVGLKSSSTERQAIIKDNALKDFDRLSPGDKDSSWAAAVDRDVDYSAKLVFSDEEDGTSLANCRLDKRLLSPRDRQIRRDRNDHSDTLDKNVHLATSPEIERDQERSAMRDRKRPIDRENSLDSGSQQPSQYERMPVDMHWHPRMAFPRPMSVMYPQVRQTVPGGFSRQQPHSKYEDGPVEDSRHQDEAADRDRLKVRSRYSDAEDDGKSRSSEESKRNDQNVISRGMTKLTSQRASKKTVEDGEVVATATVPEATQSLSVSSAGRSGDHAADGNKPAATWVARNQWTQPASSAQVISSRDHWMVGDHCDDAETTESDWQQARSTQPSSDERRQGDGQRKSERVVARELSTDKDFTSSGDKNVDSNLVRSDTHRQHHTTVQSKDRTSGRSAEKFEKSHRKEGSKDQSKHWVDNEDENESTEWNQGDDSRYQTKPANRLGRRGRNEPRSNCPPPISLRQSQQNMSTSSRYVPLKRAGSSVTETKTVVTSPDATDTSQVSQPQTTKTSNQVDTKESDTLCTRQSDETRDLKVSSKFQSDTAVKDEMTEQFDGASALPVLSRQLTWGDAVEAKESEDAAILEMSVKKQQETRNVRSKPNSSVAKFKQDSIGDKKPAQNVTPSEDKIQKFNVEDEKVTVNNKPGPEKSRHNDKAGNRSGGQDDRPPIKKMKDESNSFYGRRDDGYGRDRSDRNRNSGRGHGKTDGYRGSAARTKFGGTNQARQSQGKDGGVSDYKGEKRNTLTFERSDLHREPHSDSRKGSAQRPSEPNRKDSFALKKKESIDTAANRAKDETSQQQPNIESKPLVPMITAAAVPKKNAWDQPLQLPKTAKPEQIEITEKRNVEHSGSFTSGQPAEGAENGTVKVDVPSGNLTQSERDRFNRDVRREYRTGRGRRTSRRTATGRRQNWSLPDASAGINEDESRPRRRQQYPQYNSEDFGEDLEGERSSGNRRRSRNGPASSGRNVKHAVRDDLTYKSSAGDHGCDIAQNKNVGDMQARSRDHRRRNWRRSVHSSSQAYGRGSSGHSRTVSDDVSASLANRRGPRTISSSTAAPHSPKVQSPTDQNSSDVGNEEWETASESSDFFTHHQDPEDNMQRDARRESKKPQSSVSRRVDDSSRNHGSESASSGRRNGQTGRGNGVLSRNTGRHGAVSHVQSSDRATAASGGEQSQKVKSKPGELKDEAARAAKAEKDKKDAMANIDINNYASVVVIDDQPEVSIDDPSFLFDSNDGFQEVTSRRAQKSRQKAAALEEAKKTQELAALAKKEKEAKKRTAVTSSKLPPRLNGRRERKQHSRNQQLQQPAQHSVTDDHVTASPAADILPKIENWDNEMANNIPIVTSSANVNGASQPVRAVGTAAPVVLTPAMPIGKWDSPPLAAISVTPISSARSDDQPLSVHGTDNVTSVALVNIHSSSEIDNQLRLPTSVDILPCEEPAAQQLAIEKTIVKPMPKVDDSRTVIKKPDASLVTNRPTRQAYEPIELPSNFAFGKFSKGGDESSELKLEFTFDAELAKMATEKSDVEVKDIPPPPITMPPSAGLHRGTAVVTASVNDLVLPLQSPAADDLNMKIASVKNVWERENSVSLTQYFEQSIIATGTPRVSATATGIPADEMKASPVPQVVQPQQQSPAIIAVQQSVPPFTDYPSYVDAVATSVVIGPVDNHPSHHQGPVDVGCMDGSSGAVLDQATATLVYIDAVSSYAANGKDARNLLGEQTNVCKVRPQLQASSSPPSLAAHLRAGSTLANLSANAAQLMYAATGQGYQYAVGALTQDTTGIGLQYGGQPAYGYNMTQQPTQGAMLAPVAQSNLFLQPAPLQQSDLYNPSGYRNPFGPTAAPQPNTIMVSSATSTLMSAGVKPPSQHIYLASGSQKAGQLPTAAAVQFGPLIGQAGAQSQLCVQYETAGAGQPGLATSPVAQPADQIMASGQPSQIIGSQLVQQRTLPPTANYFSQTPLQQTGFYQTQQPTAGTAMQGSYQQLTAQQFSLSTFGHQTPAVTVAVQPVHSQLKLSAPPFKPVSQQVQMKALTSASSVSYTPSQQTASGYLQQQLYGSLLQQQQQQQQPSVPQVGHSGSAVGTQQQYHQYYAQSQQQGPSTSQPQFYGSQPQHLSEQLQLLQSNPGTAAGAGSGSGAGSTHVSSSSTSSSASGTTGQPLSNWQRTTSVSTSSHYQRQHSGATSYPGMQQQQPGGVTDQNKLPVASGINKPSSAQHQSQRSYNLSSSSASLQTRGADSAGNLLKEQQAQERRKALQQVQSFLNPQNKPPAKTAAATSGGGKTSKDAGEDGKSSSTNEDK